MTKKTTLMFLSQGLGKTKQSTMKIEFVWVHTLMDTNTYSLLTESEDHQLRESSYLGIKDSQTPKLLS